MPKQFRKNFVYAPSARLLWLPRYTVINTNLYVHTRCTVCNPKDSGKCSGWLRGPDMIFLDRATAG